MVDRDVLRAELARMKKLIAEDPRVLARFDKDGNGIIDGEEWEEVRQLVIHRLQRAEHEAELSRQMQEFEANQAAEIARMEEAIAEEEREQQRSNQAIVPEAIPVDARVDPMPPVISQDTHSDRGSSLNGRDWGELELAFDPRADEAAQNTSLADEIYQKELAQRYAATASHSKSVRLSEHGSLADCHELILEQVGGAKQFFGNMFRREYLVRDPDGTEVGRAAQSENEMLQNLTDMSILENPDLNFTLQDFITGEDYNFRRTSGLTDNSVAVFNPSGRIIARTSWTLSFVRRKYEVRVVREGLSYYVRRKFLKPWTFEVLDPFEEPIGTMQRGWSGLGFLTGGNLFHLEIDAEITPDAIWGFLATALLADLDSEHGSRRTGLDLFNS